MSHDPRHPGAPESTDSLSKALMTTQFLVIGFVLVVIASLAYVAGVHSAKGGGEGGHSKMGPSGAAGGADVAVLIKPTPELVAGGKVVFEVNCASCHGTGGAGNGPAAAALNPKPQNFTDDQWRYGGGVARIVRTISEGSPGTGMAAFTSIPLQDRFALAHYIRTLNPAPPEDKPEDLAWLGPTKAGGDSAATAGPAPGALTQPAAPALPIDQVIARLAEPEPAPGIAALASAQSGAGAALYASRCASCHGAAGEGGRRVRMIGSAPYAYLATRSLGDARGPWAQDPAAFERIVLQGIPGYAMPANGDLSREELRELHGYVQKLRALQQLARRPGS